VDGFNTFQCKLYKPTFNSDMEKNCNHAIRQYHAIKRQAHTCCRQAKSRHGLTSEHVQTSHVSTLQPCFHAILAQYIDGPHVHVVTLPSLEVEIPRVDNIINFTFFAFFAGLAPFGISIFLFVGDSLKCLTISLSPGEPGGRGVALVSFLNLSASLDPRVER